MSERRLNALHVASLLVSASCGIGFLLGTGELALHQGMAGCLYAIATALGLMMLALCTPALCSNGRSIWSRFDQLYGPSVSRSAALLSLIWMIGALAAQIRGGSAVLALTGLPVAVAFPLIGCVLIGLSFVRLSWLSAGLAICTLGCAALLTDALVETGGLDIWLHAPVLAAHSLRQTTLGHAGSTAASVAIMVVFGSDYQQFVIAADRPAAARMGCVLAAGIVFALGFLPASAVIATRSVWQLNNVTDPVQVIPVLLMHALSQRTSPNFIIAVLVASALGAGCAILRAMSEALAAVGPRSTRKSVWSRILPVTLSFLVATRGQSLIDTMVELNMAYLAAIAPLLVLGLLRWHVSDKVANASMACGCGITMASYLLRWAGMIAIPEAVTALLSLSIAVGLPAALHHRTPALSSASPEHSKTSLPLAFSPRRNRLRWRAVQDVTESSSGEHGSSPIR